MSNVIQMAAERPHLSWKIVVHFERREDGGVRAWCNEVPGFVLSHGNADAVLADVQPALDGILTMQLGRPMITTPLLDDIRSYLENCGVIDPVPSKGLPDHVEYVAQAA
ncbi:hypothetical protein FV219_05450 [Methylobacterium sp. WL122]|nr:hypothetical protein FV219_05450 [Methylobacterium sp. WL122]